MGVVLIIEIIESSVILLDNIAQAVESLYITNNIIVIWLTLYLVASTLSLA